MEHTFGLDARMLTPIVARSLNDPSATLLDFALKALKPGVGNPTSLGVYRVSGTAQTASGPVPFSVVVKHLADGRPMMDASQPEFWNYWRREIAFFESAIASRIPSEIDFPLYLGHTVLADGTELFWNSDLGELEKSIWTWSECLHATKLVAELNSIELNPEENYNWLNRDQLEGWLVLRPGFVEPLFAPTFAYARSKPNTAAALEKYEKFLHLQPEINRLLNRMPRVFVHGDFNLNNLVPRSNSVQKLIALDWQLCGIAALGSEVASIYNTACELGVIEASHENFNEICELYVATFNALNPNRKCLLDDIRLTVAAQGFTILTGVGFFLANPDEASTAEQNQKKIESMVDFYSSGPTIVYAEVLQELANF